MSPYYFLIYIHIIHMDGELNELYVKCCTAGLSLFIRLHSYTDSPHFGPELH